MHGERIADAVFLVFVGRTVLPLTQTTAAVAFHERVEAGRVAEARAAGGR